MATVSELSMYQATSLKLGAEKEDLENEVSGQSWDEKDSVHGRVEGQEESSGSWSMLLILILAPFCLYAARNAQYEMARSRMEAGEAPTEDCEREWWRLQRTSMMMEEYKAVREEERRIIDSKVSDGKGSLHGVRQGVIERQGKVGGAQGAPLCFSSLIPPRPYFCPAHLHPQNTQISDVQSTADARPNAYIPENLGIPKPYGGFSPFKPSEQGSTMRHIRKPEIKDIVI